LPDRVPLFTAYPGRGERVAIAKSVNIPPPLLADEVLQQLADLGRVPPEQRDFYFNSVRMNVQTAWELDQLVKRGLTGKRAEKLADAALALYDGLGNLSERGRGLIQQILSSEAKFLFDRVAGKGTEGLDETAYQLALLISLITGKPLPRLPSEPPQSPGRGRRSGSVKDWIFQNFVSQLYISTVTAGGSLSLEKNTPTGSLIDTLDALIPCLPEGFVPRPLPGSTLQRIRDACMRAAKEADELGF
jgi:hypothetical protein